jgi:hypothetical protein
MSQKANRNVIGYGLGFQECTNDILGPWRQLAPPVQQLKGWNVC